VSKVNADAFRSEADRVASVGRPAPFAGPCDRPRRRAAPVMPRRCVPPVISKE
jgi:hypothetical protein